MVIAFHANCVAIEDADGFWLVGFADEEFATRQYLMLTRSYTDDEQDVRHGMNTYHVERDDQIWSCYGGIDRFELHREHVVLRFTQSGTKQVKAEGIEVTFTIDDRRFQIMKQGLAHIFDGSDCHLVEVS